MPNRKKQKLTKEEKERRRIMSHSKKQAPMAFTTCRGLDYSRKSDGVMNRLANRKYDYHTILAGIFNEKVLQTLERKES